MATTKKSKTPSLDLRHDWDFFYFCIIHIFLSLGLAIYLVFFERSGFFQKLFKDLPFVLFLIHWAVLFLLGMPAVVLYGLYHKEKTSLYHVDPKIDPKIDLVGVLAELLHEKDMTIQRHSERVAEGARKMCEKLGLSASETRSIVFAAMFHDIGKLFLNSTLFYADRGTMSNDEKWAYRSHALFSQRVLSKITTYPMADVIARHHHERWDGTGFPDQLAGKRIPLGSRIITLFDAYDSMINGLNSQQKTILPDTALQIIKDLKGEKFDPDLVILFERMVSRREI